MSIGRRLLSFTSLTLLCSCGTVTPDIERGTASADGRHVYATALRVRCELKEAIALAVNRRSAYFLEKWSAKITMTLSADEKLNLSGSAGVSESFTGSALRSLALGFGGTLNQQAIRKIDVTWYESFPELLAMPDQNCSDPPGPRIQGDLKIKESLFAGIFPASASGVGFRGFADNGGPLESIQNTITFNLETGGTANPSFVLTNAVFNAGGPAIFANRERSDQLLITMGPGYIEETKRPLSKVVIRPSRELLEAHNTGRIGLQFQTFNQSRFFQ